LSQHACHPSPNLDTNARREPSLFDVSLGAPSSCEPSAQGVYQLLRIRVWPSEARKRYRLVVDASVLELVLERPHACELALSHGFNTIGPSASRSRAADPNVQSCEASREAGNASEKVCWAQPWT
jgi:hypothetical protein